MGLADGQGGFLVQAGCEDFNRQQRKIEGLPEQGSHLSQQDRALPVATTDTAQDARCRPGDFDDADVLPILPEGAGFHCFFQIDIGHDPGPCQMPCFRYFFVRE